MRGNSQPSAVTLHLILKKNPHAIQDPKMTDEIGKSLLNIRVYKSVISYFLTTYLDGNVPLGIFLTHKYNSYAREMDIFFQERLSGAT